MTKRSLRGVGVAVALACVVVLAVALYWRMTKRSWRVEGEYFDSGGVRIHYTDEGQGEPVVLIHGFTNIIDYAWRDTGIIESLKTDYRVVALDCRGHGFSGKPHDDGSYGMEMVDDVVRLMDHIEIEKAHVVGYSMGGLITLKLLTLHPERLLSAAPCGAGWTAVDAQYRADIERLADAIERDHDMRPMCEWLEIDTKKYPDVLIVNEMMDRGHLDAAALACVLRGFPEFAVTEEELRANEVHTLSIVGAGDAIANDVKRMEPVMANLSVMYVEGADHVTALGSEKFRDALTRFLKTPPRQQR